MSQYYSIANLVDLGPVHEDYNNVCMLKCITKDQNYADVKSLADSIRGGPDNQRDIELFDVSGVRMNPWIEQYCRAKRIQIRVFTRSVDQPGMYEVRYAGPFHALPVNAKVVNMVLHCESVLIDGELFEIAPHYVRAEGVREVTPASIDAAARFEEMQMEEVLRWSLMGH